MGTDLFSRAQKQSPMWKTACTRAGCHIGRKQNRDQKEEYKRTEVRGSWEQKRKQKRIERTEKNRKEQIKKNQKKGKLTEQREQKEEQTKI